MFRPAIIMSQPCTGQGVHSWKPRSRTKMKPIIRKICYRRRFPWNAMMFAIDQYVLTVHKGHSNANENFFVMCDSSPYTCCLASSMPSGPLKIFDRYLYNSSAYSSQSKPSSDGHSCLMSMPLQSHAGVSPFAHCEG